MIVTPQEVEAVMQQVVDNFLIPRFNELKMNASGEWVQSLSVRGEADKGVISGRDYTEYLAKGRTPGGMPPVSVLQKWVTAKFGIGGKEAASMAWAVAKKIEKSGTSWYEKGGSDLLEVLEEQKTIEFIQSKIGEIAKVRIAEQLIRNAQTAFK